MRAAGDWLGLVVVCAAAVWAGALEVLFVPLYVGSVIVPVVVAFALIGNVVLCRLGFALVSRTSGALVPFVCWLVPVLGLTLVTRPEGDVLVLGTGGQQWTYYALLLGGCFSGFVSIVVLTGAPRPRERPVSR